MLYITKARLDEDFIVKSNTNNFDYNMDKSQNLGTTPVGVLCSALSGCFIMCVKGYYFRKKLDVVIEYESNYENRVFTIDITVDKEINKEIRDEIYSYIEKYCTVSQMLAPDIIKNVKINGIG